MFSGQDALKEKKGAKQTVTAKAGTERRQRQLMSVRHKAHNDLMKHLRSEASEHDSDTEAATDKSVWDFDDKSPPNTVSMTLFPQFSEMMLHGSTPQEVYQGTMLIRKVLAVSRNPPYEKVVQPHIVQRLIELLQLNDYPNLQFEAAWALTNIAAGTSSYTMLLIHSGAVPPLIALAQSPHPKCCDQACWALGNIAGESAECRDVVLNHGVLPVLLSLVQKPEQPIFVMRNAVWALSNMLRGRPVPDISVTADAVPVLAALLMHHDEQVVCDAMWALSYISDGNAARVQCVLDAGIVPRVVELLSCEATMLRMPATRIMGNFAAGSDEQTQTIINAGLLQHVHALLKSKRNIRKEVCWTLSNIAAGKPSQIDALINAGVFEALIDCLRQPELDVKKEAVWTVANASFCGTPEQIKFLINSGYVEALSEVLSVHDEKILTVCLEALQLFLQLAEDEYKAGHSDGNYVANQLLNNGAVEHIEKLQSHASSQVYNLAVSIIHQYFSDDSEQHMMGGDGDANVMQDLFSAQQPMQDGQHGGNNGMMQDGAIQL